MATWAIGDVQGCMRSLEKLIDKLDFDPARDRLWLVGDLVNRGPRSVEVLRWARGLGDAVVTVLGNHDLHLLGRVAGTADPKKRDTLDDVLTAPDRDELIDWLRRRPLVHVEDGYVMVHAGLHPRWTAARAKELAGEIEAGLHSDAWKTWLDLLAVKGAHGWRDDLTGGERVRAILSFLVRVRTCDEHGVPDSHFDGAPDDAPKGHRPWFALPDPQWADHTVVFGHWAAMGLAIGPRYLGLDSGCVWGDKLTALRLDDRHLVQVKNQDG